MHPLLSSQQLVAGYAQSKVLHNIDFAMQAGEVVTLLGKNGMGKSTFIKTIMGLITPHSGTISLDGAELNRAPTYTRARLGIGYVPEGRLVFPTLSVRENLLATARQPTQWPAPFTLTKVYGLFPRLAERAQHFGGQLSGGEQQMLAIGRALMTNPRLLILDEVTEGLAPLIRQHIWQVLHELRTQGLAMLVVDKHLHALLNLADRHVAFEKGRVVWQGSSSDLEQQRHQVEKYLSV